MRTLLLLCLSASTALAYIIFPSKYDTSADKGPNYVMQRSPYGYAMQYNQYEDPSVFHSYPVSHDYSAASYYPQPYGPHLKLGAPADTASSEEDPADPVSPPAKGKKVKKPKKVTPKKDLVPTIDPAEQIKLLQAELKAKRDDLMTAYKTKLDDLNSKYQTKYATYSQIYPDADVDSPILADLEAEFDKKIDDLRTKYESKDFDLAAKYQTKINTLLPLTTTVEPPTTTTTETAEAGEAKSVETVEETKSAESVDDTLKLLVQSKIKALKDDYKKKRSAMMLKYQMKMNDLKSKYTAKYANYSLLFPDPDSPVLKQLELEFDTKVDGLVQKYQLKESDLTSKYKLKLATLSQLVGPDSLESDTDEDFTLPEAASTDALKSYIDDKISALKLEYTVQHNLLIQNYQTKLNNMTDKYSEKFVNYTKLFTADNPIFQQLEAEFSAKVDDLVLKYKLKENDLINKYKTKIDSLVPKTDDEDDQSDLSSEVLPSKKLQFSQFQIGEENYVPSAVEPVPIYSHDLAFEHPMLQLPATDDVSANVDASVAGDDVTVKPPTMADIYWITFGAKIKEAFNKTKVPPTDGTAANASVDGTADGTAATTPVPATFWASYGKSIAKSFSSAKAKIIKSMKTTTTPLSTIVDGGDTTTAAPVIPAIEPTFWDDFTKTLGDALKTKALVQSLKTTTTPASTDVDPTPATLPKLKLQMALPADASATVPVAPVPTIPGIYWKSFGDTIKQSFNKSKATVPTADDTDTTAGASPVIPPTFWANFGKSISKAFTDAKFKVIQASKPTTVSPVAKDTDTDVDSTAPVADLDETFWTDFGKQLNDVLKSRALIQAATTAAPIQSDLPHDTLIKQKLFLTPDQTDDEIADDDDDSDDQLSPILVAPIAPGLYWKGYGNALAGHFINSKGQIISAAQAMKYPFLYPSLPVQPISPAQPLNPAQPANPVPPLINPMLYPPGLYWKGYGNALAGHFINAKALAGSTSKVPTTSYLEPIDQDWIDADYPADQYVAGQEWRAKRSVSDDLQQQTQDWEPSDNLRVKPIHQSANFQRSADQQVQTSQSSNFQRSQNWRQSGSSYQSNVDADDLQQRTTQDWKPISENQQGRNWQQYAQRGQYNQRSNLQGRTQERTTDVDSDDLQQRTQDWQLSYNAQQGNSHRSGHHGGHNSHRSGSLQGGRQYEQTAVDADDLQQHTSQDWQVSGNLQQGRNRQQSEDVQQSSHGNYENSDLTQQSSHDILQRKNKLYLAADNHSPKDEVEQHILNVELANNQDDFDVEATTKPGFFKQLGQKFKDGFNKAKTTISDIGS